MSSPINWEVAERKAEEIRRLEASIDVHPYARLVYLLSRPNRRHHR